MLHFLFPENEIRLVNLINLIRLVNLINVHVHDFQKRKSFEKKLEMISVSLALRDLLSINVTSIKTFRTF